MRIARSILLRMFGRPRGVLGRLGGMIMARSNAKCAGWVIDLLDVQPNENVLEVGFGPGVAVEFLANRLAPRGRVAGVDASQEMAAQATVRNAKAIARGRVDLWLGTAERLPFPDGTFDKALAINSMQVWPDPVAGLREIRRALRAGGRVALGFTPYSGQQKIGIAETLVAAGFANVQVVATDAGFCALATKP